MKAERSNPTDSMANVPTMSADRDRSVDRRKARSGRSGNAWNAIMFIVVIMLVGALYFLWAEYQVARVEMERTNQRLIALEGQLASTGDEMTQSDAAVRVQLSGLDKEVRRLEQNRRGDKEMLLSHDKSVKNLTTRTDNMAKKQTATVSQVTSIAAQVDEFAEKVDGVNFDALRNKLEAVSKQLSSIEASQTDLKERMDSNDAFRRQVNARMSAIENPSSQTPQLQ